ncbi:MAG: pyridoxine 5'-phosphate synthase [Candidatus Brocadiaceae bacterium]|nr:pyridoxine 5'-phosphate synthase [Candidatus Brocadiaceae bacterium]
MALLGVNVDHVATVRQARRTYEPDPVWAAAEAQIGGADILTVHLRMDRRHINDRDLRLMRETVSIDLNLEMSLDPEIVDIALQTAPHMVTIVPENRQEVTTEGGLDAIGQSARVEGAVRSFAERGIPVSLFIDPEEGQIRRAAELGVAMVELHTGAYANAASPGERQARLTELADGAALGRQVGLTVNAGHGLTYANVAPVLCALRPHELHIGHSIIARALFVGIREAVHQMKEIIWRTEVLDA